MANQYKEKYVKERIENNETAAWACHTRKNKPESNVPIPCHESVKEAKNYVDTNQK